MIGMLVLSEDGNIGVAVIPSLVEPDTVILSVQFYDLQLPPIPIPASQLQAAMEVWFGNQKVTIKTQGS